MTKLALLALLPVLAACSTSTALRLIESTAPGGGGGGPDALMHASLVADDNGCVLAQTAGGNVALLWPGGYTVRGDRKRFEVLDGSAKVVARSGVELNIGGGGIDGVGDARNADCAAGKRAWVVVGLTG